MCEEVNLKRWEERPWEEGTAPGEHWSSGPQNWNFWMVAPLRDTAPEAKQQWSPHGDSVVSGPLGSQKDQGCLRVAELSGIGAGKL